MHNKLHNILIISLISLGLLLCVGYAVGSYYYSHQQIKPIYCTDIQYSFENNETVFLSESEISKLLIDINLYPVTLEATPLLANKIEQGLQKTIYIKQANCYFDLNGTCHIHTRWRQPFYRVQTAKKSYFVDTEGGILPGSTPVQDSILCITGSLSDSVATHTFMPLISYIASNPFWHAHTTMISITPNQQICLHLTNCVPLIELGDTNQLVSKLKIAERWIKQYPQLAFGNVYSKINLSYNHLIYGTKANVNE